MAIGAAAGTVGQFAAVPADLVKARPLRRCPAHARARAFVCVHACVRASLGRERLGSWREEWSLGPSARLRLAQVRMQADRRAVARGALPRPRYSGMANALATIARRAISPPLHPSTSSPPLPARPPTSALPPSPSRPSQLPPPLPALPRRPAAGRRASAASGAAPSPRCSAPPSSTSGSSPPTTPRSSSSSTPARILFLARSAARSQGFARGVGPRGAGADGACFLSAISPPQGRSRVGRARRSTSAPRRRAGSSPRSAPRPRTS